MTAPAPQAYVGKPREPVTAMYWDGQYQNGELLEIKNWIESIAPSLQTATFDTTVGESVVPYYLTVNDPVTNKSFEVVRDTYVFQQADGTVKALTGTIFEILFAPQV